MVKLKGYVICVYKWIELVKFNPTCQHPKWAHMESFPFLISCLLLYILDNIRYILYILMGYLRIYILAVAKVLPLLSTYLMLPYFSFRRGNDSQE